jgi:uncharacterized protein (UPF0264 family)
MMPAEHHVHGAVHGMLIVGGEIAYLSHLPTFSSPHDYQVVLRVSFAKAGCDPACDLLADQKKTGATAYTLKPDVMFLMPELVSTDPASAALREFQGTVFRGNFFKGEGVVVVADVKVTVEAVVHFRQYTPATEDDRMEYLLFGSDGFQYAVRYVKKAPDFDQMLSVVGVDRELWNGADTALRVAIPNRTRAADDRLGGGETVKTEIGGKVSAGAVNRGPTLTLGQELYMESGFLKDPKADTPTVADKPAVGSTPTVADPLASTNPAILSTKPSLLTSRNQRLLISVYDAQEAREAILGGARVIDCEDPAGALGDISPRRIMTIAEGVVQYKRDLEVQISTNIGENQLLFKRDGLGRAIQRHNDEIAGKASQAAMGVAAAMGTAIHPVNIVKVGLDGMPREIALETLAEVTQTVRRSDLLNLSEVVGVFFAQDMAAWNARKTSKFVIRDMLLVREYVVDANGDIDLEVVFKGDDVSMQALRDKLKDDTELFDKNGKVLSKVRLTELYDLEQLGYKPVFGERFEMSYLYSVADLVAEAGADGVMIDTRIHSKNAYICCLDYKTEGDVNSISGLPRKGIYKLEEFANYGRYCHEKGIMFWASGSIQPYQAQAVWALTDDKDEKKGIFDGDAKGLVDAMAVRSGASGAVRRVARPGVPANLIDNRATRRIYRDLVENYRPPN